MDEIPIYSEKIGFGFVNRSSAMPSREVDIGLIKDTEDGFIITETDEEKFHLVDSDNKILNIEECSTYNFGGMIYRIKVKPGTYRIEVITISGEEYTSISICGTEGPKIIKDGVWDAAGLIPIKHNAVWRGNTWSYQYVSGTEYLEIEIEPLFPNVPIGVKDIIITPQKNKCKRDKPTIFLLGDSTVKSYVFEEAPMSSWGQVIGNLFDSKKVNVVNFSNGGRALKFMYTEGRFNDLLLEGQPGDYVFLQSGHNDEREGNAIGTADGESARFGRGSTEEMFYKFLAEIFIPAIRSRGMIPILITPVTRMNICKGKDRILKNSFVKRKFPEIIKRVGMKLDITVVDLNSRSVDYMNEIGIEGTEAIVMSIEPGETPGKTNNGSYANGNPDNKIDGTHYKEALSKQYSRMILEELYKKKCEVNTVAKEMISFATKEVRLALENESWSEIYPEVCKDAISGAGAYYRNQIEKLVQLGVMKKDHNGEFHPFKLMSVSEYITVIKNIWNINGDNLDKYTEGILSREVMGAILYDSYGEKFGYEEENKPKYMTDYNGKAMSPEDPNFDPNLSMNASQYYPTIPFEKLNDLEEISNGLKEKIEVSYKLGLIRSERGIHRGSNKNGVFLEPKKVVTREKAAKSLYYMWVLSKEIKAENHNLL
jgi:lysophospholipase L1-like esterase